MTTDSTLTPQHTASGAPRAGGAADLAGRTVSRIGYGAMQLEHLRADRRAAIALLRRVAELGVDHVDTAHFYGDGFVNDVIRDAFRPEDGITVVSKVGADPEPDPGAARTLRPAQRPEELRASVEANLTGLGLDHIPVVNLRRLDAGPGLRAEGDQRVDLDDQLAVLTALRDAGKIGAIGLSGVTLDILRRAVPAGIVCVQNAYSLVTRDDEEMLRLCAAEGIAWVPFFPLGGAFPGVPKVTDDPAVLAVARSLGHTPAQIGLAWLLRHAPHVLLIPGTANPRHLEENIAAGAIHLDATTLAALDAVARPTGSG
ncbi:aldo/keto reductase [Streptantibioticus cattleyicolor]|uniref:Oxidoreductase n=1 Tax=Streptantibioticus cattleyicolor (strain ATCC 35852 / DSM 46488 / JCM 4925 / NBRC 14057 / NRRL 8057) TaxID=1003195 RepID=F8JKD8_STREN|nr:aldo/keto reductase [Streptantibioticus cattleyicolor]AEW98498.1 oxidoreductase [Streptantibioticus cattleyicolor NRRL 8057 = DSM 46488]CCB72444.1 putative oxidoreductase ydbC [Streptantibioticus cattleyicolor NRRL 8057 = DSM 46488]